MKSPWITTICLLLAAPLTLAETPSYPSHPVKVVVPFTAGGGSDAAARFFSDKLRKSLDQPFIVENRPGGVSGSIGTMAVKGAPADGYTILVGSSSPMVINAVTVKNLPYDPIKDFRPVAGLTKNTTVILTSANSRFKTLGELIAAGKGSAVPQNVGTASAGFQLAASWFGMLAGIKYTHVPYKGLSQVLTDVAGNNLDWAIVDLAGATSLIKSGMLRALAVTDERRHPAFPDVPTVKESGYPEYIYNTWTSFHVRADTPDDVTAKLAEALQKIMATSEAEEYMRKTGTELLRLAPAEMQKFQMEELNRFRSVATATGFQAN
jgi:tripartite-type tricarboxylate transporter receptor subunit TctC